MFEDPEFWVALAFVIFVGVLAKFGVPKMALSALDARSDRIKQALEEDASGAPGVPHGDVKAWLKSLGTDKELPPPRPKKR